MPPPLCGAAAATARLNLAVTTRPARIIMARQHRQTHTRMSVMKALYALVFVILLAGCQSMASNDPNSYWFRPPAGTQLVLNEPLNIPAQRAHIMLQHGKVATGASEFDVACRFEVRDLGPRTIQPDTFQVTGYSSQEEWVNYPDTKRYYKTIRLSSEHQSGIMPMVCAYSDWPLRGRPVTQTQIVEALGNYFTFKYPD